MPSAMVRLKADTTYVTTIVTVRLTAKSGRSCLNTGPRAGCGAD